MAVTTFFLEQIMKATGVVGWNMALEYSNLVVETSTQEVSAEISSMAKDHTSIPMVIGLKDCGKMERSKERDVFMELMEDWWSAIGKRTSLIFDFNLEYASA